MSGNEEARISSDKIEALLGGFVPNAANVHRDSLMYQAGYRAACGLAARRAHNHFWKATTGLMTAATIALAVMLADRGQVGEEPRVASSEPRTESTEPVVETSTAPPAGASRVEHATPAPPAPRPLLLADPSSNYLALRAAVLDRGVDAWPTDYREPAVERPVRQSRGASTIRDLMQEVLPAAPQPQQTESEQPTEASASDEETIV